MKNKLLKIGVITTIAIPIIGVVSCGKKSSSKGGAAKLSAAQLKAQEQSKINVITIQNIKDNDGLDSPVNAKIALPTSSTLIKTSIEVYVNGLNGVLGWTATIKPFTPNLVRGSLDYTIVLSKTGYISKTINVSYIAGLFKTALELKIEEQSKINAITIQNIKDNDGLNSPVNAKIALPTSSTLIKTSIEVYINGLNGVLGWTAAINPFTPNLVRGSLDYTIVLSKTGYTSKTINVSYIAGLFKTALELKIEEQSKINAITIQNIKDNDGINSPVNAKIALPTSSTLIKTSIEVYINGLNGVLGWTATINPFTPNLVRGSLDYTIVLSKVGYTSKTINVSYIAGSFQTETERYREQSKINAITIQNIKDNDGLNSPKNAKITLPTSPTLIKTSIEAYINGLNGVLGWTATINPFTPNLARGSLEYTVVLSKAGYTSKTINVSYIDGSFKTTIELKEQSKIDAITIQNIKDNDGLNSPKNAKIALPTSSTLIKTSIEAYINGLNGVLGWTATINPFTSNLVRGSLDYTIVLLKAGYTSKTINVSYIARSFKTTIELKEQSKIDAITIQNIKDNDGLNSPTNAKIAPPTSPTSPTLIKTLIEKYVNGLNGVSGWTATINSFTPDIINGGLDYAVTLSKVGYTSEAINVSYIDGSFKTTLELQTKEQSKIDAITIQNIKDNDGINSPINAKIAPPTSPTLIKTSIEVYVNGLNGVSGWTATINPFTPNLVGGSLDYIVVLSKVGYNSETINVPYIDGSFKTTLELQTKEQSKIDAITIQNIKDNDGINSPASAKILAPYEPTPIKRSISTYINSLNGVSGWTVTINRKDVHKDLVRGSLDYTIVLSKAGYKSKELTISYIDGSFITSAEKLEEQSEISLELNAAKIKANDGLNSPTNVKISLPTSSISIKTSIEAYVNGLNGVSGWTATINSFTPDIINGGLDYTVTLSKAGGYHSTKFDVSYNDGFFTTVELNVGE